MAIIPLYVSIAKDSATTPILTLRMKRFLPSTCFELQSESIGGNHDAVIQAKGLRLYRIHRGFHADCNLQKQEQRKNDNRDNLKRTCRENLQLFF